MVAQATPPANRLPEPRPSHGIGNRPVDFLPQIAVSSSRGLGVEVEKVLAVSPAGRFGARCEGINLTLYYYAEQPKPINQRFDPFKTP